MTQTPAEDVPHKLDLWIENAQRQPLRDRHSYSRRRCLSCEEEFSANDVVYSLWNKDMLPGAIHGNCTIPEGIGIRTTMLKLSVITENMIPED